LRESEVDIREKIETLELTLRAASRSNPALRAPGPHGRSSPLSVDELEGAREAGSDLGRCLVLEKNVGVHIGLADLRKAVSALSGDAGNECTEGGADRGAPCPRYVFLDLETTGFAATPLFLAGTMYEKDGALLCTQLLARDYSEERALLGMLDSLISAFDMCITFNGKSFDLPYLRERAKYHRLELVFPAGHLDLLHHARRAWRDRLPNCRLATLEWHILGRHRGADVPGWEVPCIYHDFVHTDDARRLVGVIRHNFLDVVSMAELLICLAEAL
jgi:uncharacterized protein YprB with RNaseH-like and TPR domain